MEIVGDAEDMSSLHRDHPPFRGAYFLHICNAVFSGKYANAYILTKHKFSMKQLSKNIFHLFGWFGGYVSKIAFLAC